MFNVHIDSITSLLSFSEIDIALAAVNYDGIPIDRTRPGNYQFKLKVDHPTVNYDIVSLVGGVRNFDVEYFYSKEDLSNQNISKTEFHVLNAAMSISDASTNINKGLNRILSANVTQGMNYTECYNITHVCFLISSNPKGSFIDRRLENNLRCFPLDEWKDCEPGKKYT